MAESEDGPEGGGKGSQPEQSGTNRGNHQILKNPSDLVLMEIDRSLDPNTEKGTGTTRRLASTPKVERTGISTDDGVARQRALVGNSANDEQWSDDLSSH